MLKKTHLSFLLLFSAFLLVFAGAIGLMSLQKNSGAATNSNPLPADNSPKNLIRVTTPQKNDYVTSPVLVEGEARGTWYFEASFPVKLIDSQSRLLGQAPAQAQGEWMTKDFVPFSLSLEFATPTTETGMLILEKDNPSGLPQYDSEFRIPVRFKFSEKCKITGCNSNLCVDEYTTVSSTCEYKPEYACYKTAVCERQKTGECGWTLTEELIQCIRDAQLEGNSAELIP